MIAHSKEMKYANRIRNLQTYWVKLWKCSMKPINEIAKYLAMYKALDNEIIMVIWLLLEYEWNTIWENEFMPAIQSNWYHNFPSLKIYVEKYSQ